MDYHGHVVELGRLSVAKKTTEAFDAFMFPKVLMQVRSFLGACNVYRRFLMDFSKIGRPLADMTRKETKPDFDSPIESQTKSI